MGVSSIPLESFPDLVVSRADLEDILTKMAQNNQPSIGLADIVKQIMARRESSSSDKASSSADNVSPMAESTKSPQSGHHTPLFAKSKFCAPNEEGRSTDSSPEFNFKTPRKVFPEQSQQEAPNAFQFDTLKEQLDESTGTSTKFPVFAAPSTFVFNPSLPAKGKGKNRPRHGVSTFGAVPPPPPAAFVTPPASNDEPMEEDLPSDLPPPPAKSDFEFQFSSFHIGAESTAKVPAAKHPADTHTTDDSRPHKHTTADASHMKENIIGANTSQSGGTKPPSASQPFGVFQLSDTSAPVNQVPAFNFTTTSSFTIGATNLTPTKKKTSRKPSPRKPQRPPTMGIEEKDAQPHESSVPASNAEEEREDMRRMEALANLMKNQGKENYTSQQYDTALDAYTKALNAAPPMWSDRSMVLGNRAATFMMLERYARFSCRVKLI